MRIAADAPARNPVSRVARAEEEGEGAEDMAVVPAVFMSRSWVVGLNGIDGVSNEQKQVEWLDTSFFAPISFCDLRASPCRHHDMHHDASPSSTVMLPIVRAEAAHG